MLSRLAQGVNSVLQELSGEEHPDGGSQDGLVPQLPPEEGPITESSEPSEDNLERLAQLEQLVVQLKEFIREKDSQLAHSEKQLKDEKESSEARFTKLKLQAKAKVASLTKQINELKGQEGLNISQSSDSSLTLAPGVEEELQQLRLKLSEEEAMSRTLREQLAATEHVLREKEEGCAEQVRLLQAVVSEKDVRFQEQIQKHEDELLRLNTESRGQNDAALQQTLQTAQRRIEELEESMHSRSQVVEMLQQELNSADQQKQILTAQFRQMEQELSEADRLQEEERQQWAQKTSRTHEELEALRNSLDQRVEELTKLQVEITQKSTDQDVLTEKLAAMERERHQWTERGRDATASAEAELAALRAILETSEREKEEVTRRLEVEVERRVAELHELQEKLEVVEREGEQGSKSEEEELSRLQIELASLKERLDTEREEQEAGHQAMRTLWRGLLSLTGADTDAEGETSDPSDPAQLLALLTALEVRLGKARAEEQEREAHFAQVTLTLESLQGQLDKSNAEGQEAVARMLQLERQLGTNQGTDDSSHSHVTDLSVKDLDGAERDGFQEAHASVSVHDKQVLALKQQLFEREKELDCLRAQLAVSEDHSPKVSIHSSSGDFPAIQDSTAGPPDLLEDAPEEETTLIPADISGLSISADNESSPELIGPQSGSPGESKGASSDEMVTSSDSEVAHSSWTLLDAVNQDGAQEWPPLLQDFGNVNIQSWDEGPSNRERSNSCIIQVEPDSMIIHETVEVQLSQQAASQLDPDSTSGQAFAQALAEELQRRYSELAAELQLMRDAASVSQGKVHHLEEELKLQRIAQEEAESKSQSYEEELKLLRAEHQGDVQSMTTEVEERNIAKVTLEEQMESLHAEVNSKETVIQALKAQLNEAQNSIIEQEGQVRMLSAQFEDRELASCELEQRLVDMERRVQEVSQEAELAKTALSDQSSELEELQLRMSQKEEEMMELSNSMTSKLLQAGEEKFLISSEVKKLKDQVFEFEKAWDDEQRIKGHNTTGGSEELSTLHKDNEELLNQIATMKKDGEMVKKKLQVALLQRKELMKKVADFEDAKTKSGEVAASRPNEDGEKDQDIDRLETLLRETRQALRLKEETLEILEQKISRQDETLSEALAANQRLTEEVAAVSHTEQQNWQAVEENSSLQLQVTSLKSELETLQDKLVEKNESEPQNMQAVEDHTQLQSQVASLELELETSQKKLQDAVDSRKDTIRKAKEKDRHHREQLKQQREEYTELQERYEAQDGEKDMLRNRLKELEEFLAQKEAAETDRTVHMEEDTKTAKENVDKPTAGDWAQEDWVDFTSTEKEMNQEEKIVSTVDNQQPLPVDDAILIALKDEIKEEQAARSHLQAELQERQTSLSLREAEILELGKELEALREKERQIYVLSDEIEALKTKCQQAEAHAEMLKAEVDAAADATKGSQSDPESPIAILQAEVEEFKQFLQNKNDDIIDLSRQLGEQNSLLLRMQETVSGKDHLIASLQDDLRAEQEKRQHLEAEIPQRQEEEKGNTAKLQQLQRKLQAALLSRKEALKENQALKEEHAAAEKINLEQQEKIEAGQAELSKLRVEREKLIEEVDKTLLENQSLNASCESLKLAMEGISNEKEECKRQVACAKEEADRVCRELEEKVQGMKDEYETLLSSYENVSDEAERVRRVLEAARQERQELAAKARAHEGAKQEAERVAEEAQKEIDAVKDKMRKFAKAKQQKIMDLEEENERLREQEERKGTKWEDAALRKELVKVKEEMETLRGNLDSAVAERDSLEQLAAELKQQLAQETETKTSLNVGQSFSETVVEETIAPLLVNTISAESSQEQPDKLSIQTDLQKESNVTSVVVVESDSTEIIPKTSERDSEQMEIRLMELETTLETTRGKLRELEAALEAEKGSTTERESELKAELTSLEQQLQESIQREESLREDCSKRETQLQELRISLEAERDDLEERLMNQLAQVNGSIAGYQQEAADGRDRLADLQRDLERLEREQAELDALLQSEREKSSTLEEAKRQAERERAEAEAEAGRQRELEQQLKSAQRVREGSQSRVHQLEELLREKQLELRQMQKDCIQYQERISKLSKESKALLMGTDELRNELQAARSEITKVLEEKKQTEMELTLCKEKLEVTRNEASKTLTDKMASEKQMQQREVELKAETERTIDEVRYRLGGELKHLELRLEDAYREREKEEGATQDARSMAVASNKQAQEVQSRLDEALARLAAFSRSMSSLQDDRDRVLDEARQWENRFHSALQGKETEVRQAETKARELAEQLQKETSLREELQLSLGRLQKAEEQWLQQSEEDEKKHSERVAALEKERGDLQHALSQAESSLAQTRSQLASLEAEAEGVRNRAKALEEAVGRLQGEANDARAELKDRETEERRLCLSLEQLETDLRSSKVLTETLQTDLSEKEKREVELLGEKEQAVTQAAEEARREADSRAEVAEKQLEVRREELRGLEERLRKAEGESSQSKARLDAFTKAMGSLQDDRDRVLSQYKQLEERHLQVMMDKDSLIQEAASENNSLKEEIRVLFSQRDDLNAEKAKLAAQLHGYRDDLNQVLTMKDSQHKHLLQAQLERIGALDREKEELEVRIQVLEREAQAKAPPVEMETLSREAPDAPGAEVEKLREQLQAARAKAASLEETLEGEREAQATRSKELSELRWEGGVLRSEAETAEERVAELARDLLELEQKLLVEREASEQLRAQNQAFGKAMASLQDSCDQAQAEAKELQLRLEEVSKASKSSSQLSRPTGGTTGEVWSLKNALSALQNDRERMLGQMQKQRMELDRLGSGDLGKLNQTLEEERRKAQEREETIGAEMREKDTQLERHKQELQTLRQEQQDWQAQAELLKQQTLASLSERDQQIRRLSAVLEETSAQQPKLLEQQENLMVASAPGGPQEHMEGYKAECAHLQQRLDEELELRLAVEEQLMASQESLKRYTQGDWESRHEDRGSETSLLIEPPEGAVTRMRSGGPGLARMLRVAFCSRQRTPLLVTLYLMVVHVLLLLCAGGYL